MAPTAAMLILSNNHKSNSPSSLPSPSLPSTFYGAKVSILRWVSEHNPISKPKSDEKGWERFTHEAETRTTVEKRFKEALDISCW
ncbi:hypothetical protein TorRG33x02_104600 [Trema orientale]|uniref:Uncharacterized protein n=1 Tax=Trema orientale TaxID=63057 RepID=A0A2P5F7L1_TREOI|nr:hypothetical protein TorRG33x02_104600 [Trema orientale]